MIRVKRIKTRRVNVYLLHDGKQGILVDAGAKKYLPLVMDAIAAEGLRARDICNILITHTHYDHVDGLAELKKITDARIVVHEKESEALNTGFKALPDGTTGFARLIIFIGRNILPRLAHFEPAVPDLAVGRSTDITDLEGEIRIIHTPGHTSGSICILVENKHAFVGDTLFAIAKKSVFPPFADDIPSLLSSWKVLLETGCSVFYPGHGPPISRDKFEKEYLRWTVKYSLSLSIN